MKQSAELEKSDEATEAEKKEIKAQYSKTEMGSRCDHDIEALIDIESRAWLKKAQKKKDAPGWEQLPETCIMCGDAF